MDHLKNKDAIFNVLEIEVVDFLNGFLETKVKLQTRVELSYIQDKVIHHKKEEFKFNLFNPPVNICWFYDDLDFPINVITHRIVIENDYSQQTILKIMRDCNKIERRNKYLKRNKNRYIRWVVVEI